MEKKNSSVRTAEEKIVINTKDPESVKEGIAKLEKGFNEIYERYEKELLKPRF